MDSSSQKSWRCSVCGYVHIGNHPPDFCPVCGVGASEFEAMVPEKPIAREKASDMWRCTICGFIHNGDQPPASCPVCAATSTLFAPVLPEKGADEMLPEEREKIVIVGAGIAGLTAAETIREVSPDADIHLISNEDCLPYYRLNLTRFLAGETDQENLTIHPEEWYAEKRISLIHDQATSIDSTGKRVLLSQKGELPYDKLIITMGAHPFRPSYPGGELSGILTLRTLNDAKDILKLSKNLDGCLCVGGGVLGIETAGALARRGVQVTLLEGHDWLMPRQLNRSAGNLLKKSLEKIGVQVKTNVRIARFLGEENVSGAELTDGTRISTKLAVITTGIRSNTYLAKRSGLDIDSGIQVDGSLQTSLPNIYAAGDVAEHSGTVYGVWGAAQFQGKIAARNAVGLPTGFGGIPRSNTLKVLHLDLMSIGKISHEDGSYRVVDGKHGGSDYYYFLFHDNLLAGAILLGNTRLSSTVKKVIEEKQDCSPLLFDKAALKDVIEFLKGKK